MRKDVLEGVLRRTMTDIQPNYAALSNNTMVITDLWIGRNY